MSVWVKSWDGTNWEVKILEESQAFPEPLRLLLLGNRQPVLFVEGERCSIDERLYSVLYPKHLVVSRGSCVGVQESTRAFREAFAHVRADGIIDRDRHSDESIDALKKRDNLHVLPVAEVENLLLTQSVVRCMARLQKKDPDAVFGNVKEFVLKQFKSELEFQACEHTTAEMKRALSGFDATSSGRAKNDPVAMAKNFRQFAETTHPDRIFEAHQARFKTALLSENYEQVLSVFNRKSLGKQVSSLFGLDDYPRSVLDFLSAGDTHSDELRSSFLEHLPTLDVRSA